MPVYEVLLQIAVYQVLQSCVTITSCISCLTLLYISCYTPVYQVLQSLGVYQVVQSCISGVTATVAQIDLDIGCNFNIHIWPCTSKLIFPYR